MFLGSKSPDSNGIQIAFTSYRSGNLDIWVMPQRASRRPNYQQSGRRRIARVVARRHADRVRVPKERSVRSLVMSATGEPETQLTSPVPGQLDYWPAWSPDGAGIAFSRLSRGINNIWVLTLPTTGVEPGAAPAIHAIAHDRSASRGQGIFGGPLRAGG